jgi:hypothetical protein
VYTCNQCGLAAPFGRWTWLSPRPSHRRYVSRPMWRAIDIRIAILVFLTLIASGCEATQKEYVVRMSDPENLQLFKEHLQQNGIFYIADGDNIKFTPKKSFNYRQYKIDIFGPSPDRFIFFNYCEADLIFEGLRVANVDVIMEIVKKKTSESNEPTVEYVFSMNSRHHSDSQAIIREVHKSIYENENCET